MLTEQNISNNNALTALTQRAAPHVLTAIKQASAKTGVNFAYLVEQAAAESNFKPAIQSQTSSATGLYQFIESTWLGMVEKHGDKYGLGDFADKIKQGLHKQDPALKKEILNLRKDPQKASLLAAEFAADNKSYMESQGIKDIGSVELYFAHFMGAGGATAFLKANERNPLQTAADLFPKAAHANRNVFYDQKTGEARTLAGVHDFFAQKFGASGTDSYAPKTPLPTPPAPVNFAQTTEIPAFSQNTDEIFANFINQSALSILRPQNATPATSMERLSSITPPSSLLHSPVELMLLARLDEPKHAER